MFFYNVGLLLVLFFGVKALSEGERCSPHSDTVICRHFRNCTAAINDVRNLRTPLICGFDSTGPIVCCDEGPTTTPAPTTPRPARRPSTPRYDLDLNKGQCPPVPLNLTSPKTGRKAWDKCLEYQQQLVYPCVADLYGSKMRVDHCGHTTGPQPHLRVGEITDTSYEQFPHMARVNNGDEDKGWWCSAAILSEVYILTAARCTHGVDINNIYVIIRAMQTPGDSGAGGWWRHNIKSIKHSDYIRSSLNHHIALLETETQISLSRFVVPACLPVGDVQHEHATATWVLRTSNDATLRKVTLTKYQTEECAEHYPSDQGGFDGHSQPCYGDTTSSTDTCQIQYSSLLQITNNRLQCMYTVVGVLPFSLMCGRGTPLLYTRLAPYVSWIESVVWP